MRHFLAIAITCCAFMCSGSSVSYAGKADCPQQKLQEISSNDQKAIVLSAKAQRQADCLRRSGKIPSLEGLVESKISDWWVMHLPDEDLRELSVVAERNRAVLSKIVPKNLDKELLRVEFQDIELQAMLKIFSHICHVKFKMDTNTPIYISVLHEFKSNEEKFCLDLAAILAAQGISLTKNGEYVVLSSPNKPLEPTR